MTANTDSIRLRPLAENRRKRPEIPAGVPAVYLVTGQTLGIRIHRYGPLFCVFGIMGAAHAANKIKMTILAEPVGVVSQ